MHGNAYVVYAFDKDTYMAICTQTHTWQYVHPRRARSVVLPRSLGSLMYSTPNTLTHSGALLSLLSPPPPPFPSLSLLLRLVAAALGCGARIKQSEWHVCGAGASTFGVWRSHQFYFPEGFGLRVPHALFMPHPRGLLLDCTAGEASAGCRLRFAPHLMRLCSRAGECAGRTSDSVRSAVGGFFIDTSRNII
jgi:hypothetical protein